MKRRTLFNLMFIGIYTVGLFPAVIYFSISMVNNNHVALPVILATIVYLWVGVRISIISKKIKK